MTLIIGIKCEDGVVVGADGAATLGALGTRTVRQPMKKLTVIDERVIVGVSGPVGMQQRFVAEVEELWRVKKLSGKKPEEAMTIIREVLWKHVEPEMKAATVSAQLIGTPLAAESAISHAIVACVLKQPCLIQYNQQCSPELASADLPFVAIGSGQSLADPFLAFLRDVFWPNRLPSVEDAIFATVWTLKHAIATLPGGVAGPIQVAAVKRVGGNWGAKILDDRELQEHDVAISAARDRLAGFREALHAEAQEAESPPEPPRHQS
ncbi:MAG: hypothetical protein ACE5JL_10390 [Dehalococcoidia bacterium]